MKTYKTPIMKPVELKGGILYDPSKADPNATSTDQMNVMTIKDGWEEE